VTIAHRDVLRARLAAAIDGAAARGRVTDGLAEELRALPDSYDALDAFATRLAELPTRDDWPFDEPDDLDAIRAASDPSRQQQAAAVPDAAERARAAFLGSVCGCMLGKPFEIAPTLDELRGVLEPHGEWPLTDYPTEAAVKDLRELQGQWRELVRERIDHVAADDDINYTVLGMLALEQHGAAFQRSDLLRLWLYNLPVLATFGPERTLLTRAATAMLEPGGPVDLDAWVTTWNPADELCGALIRADAYGYACLGDPARAVELAWRDAGMTHRGTGLYGALFVAAAIAVAPLHDDPLDVVREALRHVPQRSRFADAVRFAIDAVERSTDWLAAYREVNARYGDFGHCQVLQEVGTLVVTLRFAESVGHGIALQVMQGNDTDSFGATAGSILGAFFGPGHLDERWTRPFRDRIQLALATTWISSLAELADRMAALPGRLAGARGAPDPGTAGTG
jgi:ADP-ribosylglycohydrolase